MFGFGKKNPVIVDELAEAVAQSAGAVALFDTALTGLTAANQALLAIADEESDIINVARQRLNDAYAQVNKNEKLAANIRKLVEV